MKQKGFTLIELLVVIAIISLLASIVLAALNGARASARDAKRVADLHQLSQALELYASDHGSYPTNIQSGWFDSRPFVSAPNNWATLGSFLVPNYMAAVPVPPLNGQGDGAMCGNCDEYHYAANASASEYSLCTYLATDAPVGSQNVMGRNTYGPWYCIDNGCGSATLLLDGVCQ